MIVDANILLYARNSSDPRHNTARRWLESVLNGETRVGLPWSTIGAFFRISTNPRAFPDPLTPEEAWEQVTDWLDAPRAWTPEPTAAYREILGRLITENAVSGPLTSDAMLAALAVDHGVAVASTDADFDRFDGLRHIDPLS